MPKCRSLSQIQWKRVVGLATTLAMIVCASGMPMPVAVKKAGSELYPCMNCSCGCVSAEMCWQNCCCFSTEQKIAWAEKHGVSPPEYVIRAAKGTTCTHAGASCNKESKSSCCDTKIVVTGSALSSCCQAYEESDSVVEDSLCEPSTSCCGAVRKGTSDDFMRVVVFSALKCRGISVTVSLMPPSLPIEHEEWNHFSAGRYESTWWAENLYRSPHLDIAVPPPDFARS